MKTQLLQKVKIGAVIWKMTNIKITLVILLFMTGCGKDPEPGKPTSLERPYIRNLKVEGAKDVTMDHSARTIQIVLPETYASDEMVLQMDLIDGVSVSSTDPIKKFGFRGFKPIPLNIMNNYSQQFDVYTIYVDVEGDIKAHLREDLHLTENGTCLANVVFTSGMGTVPERTSEEGAMSAWLGDSKNSKPAIKNTGSNLFEFADAYKLVPSESIDLSIRYGEEHYEFPEKEKITKWIVRTSVDSLSTWWNSLSQNTDLNIVGGCFLPQKKYQIKLQNYFVNVPAIQTEYKGTQKLAFKTPASVKNGNYYVGIYEGNELISKHIYTVSSDAHAKGMQQVWTEFSKEVTPIALDGGEFEPLVSAPGKEIFINPYPMFTRTVSSAAVRADELPTLRIVGNGSTYDVLPQVREDRAFGDGAVVLYYPGYSLPAGIAPGKYAIQLNFKEWGVTGPFCKPLEIK